MRAEIISIGEELLSGDKDILDTNSVYITKLLRSTGLRVIYKTTVGDDEQRITDVIKLALERSDVIITTGGLGPTVDDMTRQGVANAVGQRLVFRQELMDDIAAKFAKFGTRMSDNNRSQAMMPEHATTILNPVGTAPSFIVEHAGKVIISLPGVPREMKYLMDNAVMPYLQKNYGAKGIYKNRVLRTAGIGESLVDEKVGDLEKLTNPTVGLAAHAGQTDIRIAAQGATEAEADKLIAEVEAEVRKRLGSFIYGVEDEPLEGAFVAAVKQAGIKVALVEVGTGGVLRQRIESQPQGAELIASAEVYDTIDGMNHVSGENDFKALAEQAAKDAREKNGVGLAIAVISEDRGTAIAVWNGNEVRSRTYGYGGLALGGAEWASGWGMSMSWHLLTTAKEQKDPQKD